MASHDYTAVKGPFFHGIFLKVDEGKCKGGKDILAIFADRSK